MPEDWKRANVSPIYKKRNKNIAENYRPLRLTSQCSKLMESIIRDEIVQYLVFLDKITEWVDQGEMVDVVFLDFAKAFDKVPHQRLLLKVASLGIGGKLFDWISNGCLIVHREFIL